MIKVVCVGQGHVTTIYGPGTLYFCDIPRQGNSPIRPIMTGLERLRSNYNFRDWLLFSTWCTSN